MVQKRERGRLNGASPPPPSSAACLPPRCCTCPACSQRTASPLSRQRAPSRSRALGSSAAPHPPPTGAPRPAAGSAAWLLQGRRRLPQGAEPLRGGCRVLERMGRRPAASAAVPRREASEASESRQPLLRVWGSPLAAALEAGTVTGGAASASSRGHPWRRVRRGRRRRPVVALAQQRRRMRLLRLHPCRVVERTPTRTRATCTPAPRSCRASRRRRPHALLREQGVGREEGRHRPRVVCGRTRARGAGKRGSNPASTSAATPP